MLNTAMEHFKTICSTTDQNIAPLETWIIHLIKISDVFLDAKITHENVINKLREAYAVSDLVESFVESENGKYKAEKVLKKGAVKKKIDILTRKVERNAETRVPHLRVILFSRRFAPRECGAEPWPLPGETSAGRTRGSKPMTLRVMAQTRIIFSQC